MNSKKTHDTCRRLRQAQHKDNMMQSSRDLNSESQNTYKVHIKYESKTKYQYSQMNMFIDIKLVANK